MKTVQFVALVLTALLLIPSGAHLFALPNKMAMTQEQYFTAQAIYRGWALLGAVLAAALIANLALAYTTREERSAVQFALTAAALIALNLVIFFIWTFPANQATENWTVQPPNWGAIRTQWEYSHAANAIVVFVAFCCTTLSVLASRR